MRQLAASAGPTARRRRVSVLEAVCLLMVLPCVAVRAAEPQHNTSQRPNVLFIVVDDMNTDLGAYGHPWVKTPHIDRLATRGVRFDRAYAQYPLCNPSRESFLSGRRPETTRAWDNQAGYSEGLNLPEYFRQHGYFTARLGKVAHHAGCERPAAWDVSEDAPRRLSTSPALPANADGEPWFIRQLLLSGPTDGDDADEPDGMSARRAIELMQPRRDKPFFVAVGFHKPHLPFIAPRRYFDLYPEERTTPPRDAEKLLHDVPAAALRNSTLDRHVTDDEARRAIAAYYACLSFIDAQVGLLIDAIDQLDLAANTIVILFSDHGFHLGDHGLWQKGTLFEQATRVPLIIAAPGKQAGATSSGLVELIDLFPTLVELCGLPVPDNLDGKSLAPLLDQPHRPWKSAAFSMTWPSGVSDHPANRPEIVGSSVRNQRYRDNFWEHADAEELYDHHTDPGEYRNLANDPAHASLLKELRRLRIAR